MRPRRSSLPSLPLALLVAAAALPPPAVGQTGPTPTRFQIRVDADARPEPLHGRVFVAIARSGETEPRLLYGDRKPHCWIGPVTMAERLVEMGVHLLATMPDDATAAWWTYR